MSYNVKLKSGKQFTVKPDQKILDAALDAQITLPYSCKSGTCGTCKARLLTGKTHYPDGQPGLLSEKEIDDGLVLLCQCCADSDLEILAREVDLPADVKPVILPVRVVEKTRLSDEIVSLRLKAPEGRKPQFLAGQYIDFLLQGGRRRAFSLASAPSDDLLEVHVRHIEGGEFTGFIFNELKEKALLRLEGPLGTFFIRSSDKPILMIGGGTGYGPLRSMLLDLFEKGDKRQKKLFWGVQKKENLYALDELAVWQNEHPELEVHTVVQEADENWAGLNGYVHEAVFEHLGNSMADYDVYMSGPPAMINAGREMLKDTGLPAEQLFFDSFDFAID